MIVKYFDGLLNSQFWSSFSIKRILFIYQILLIKKALHKVLVNKVVVCIIIQKVPERQ